MDYTFTKVSNESDLVFSHVARKKPDEMCNNYCIFTKADSPFINRVPDETFNESVASYGHNVTDQESCLHDPLQDPSSLVNPSAHIGPQSEVPDFFSSSNITGTDT